MKRFIIPFAALLLAALATTAPARAEGEDQCRLPKGKWTLTYDACPTTPPQAAPKPKAHRQHRVAPPTPTSAPPFPVVPGPVANGCPAGFGIRFHVYPLRQLHQQRPDLYARAMQLVAVATERQKRGLGYAGEDFSRTLGATLRRSWGVHADVSMSVEVRYLDPRTKQLTSRVGAIRVEHGIGDLRLPGDPRQYITELLLPSSDRIKIVTEPTPVIRDLPEEWPDCLQNISVGIYENPYPGV